MFSGHLTMSFAIRKVPNRFVASVALAIGLLAGAASGARADVYAYSTQTLDNFTFTGAAIQMPLTTSTQDSAILTGFPGAVNQDPTDALVSFVGAANAGSAQNFFGQGGALGSPSFARGDVRWAGGVASTVAEGSLIVPGQASGAASFNISAFITLSAAGVVTLGFDYDNDLVAQIAGSYAGLAAANYSFNFTITNQAGNNVLFSSSPDEVNTSVSVIVSPGSIIESASGSVSITSTTLQAGTYLATITGSSQISLRQAVPEPTSVALLGCGVAAVVATAARQTRRR